MKLKKGLFSYLRETTPYDGEAITVQGYIDQEQDIGVWNAGTIWQVIDLACGRVIVGGKTKKEAIHRLGELWPTVLEFRQSQLYHQYVYHFYQINEVLAEIN